MRWVKVDYRIVTKGRGLEWVAFPQQNCGLTFLGSTDSWNDGQDGAAGGILHAEVSGLKTVHHGCGSLWLYSCNIQKEPRVNKED